MATRKRRRGRHTTKRRRSTAVATNSPRRRVHHHKYRRRNPPAFSVKGVLGGVTDAGKGAIAMVAGEGGTRYIRSQLLSMPDGQTLSTIADLGIGTAAGLLVAKFVGRQAGRDATAGVYAFILRQLAKQSGVEVVKSVLGDPSPSMSRFVLKDGKLVPLGSWAAGTRQLGSWPRGEQLAGVDDEEEAMFGA